MKTCNRSSTAARAIAALALAVPMLASAVPVLPDTDLSTWTTVGVSGSTAPNGSINETAALANGLLGYVSTAGSNAIGAAFTPTIPEGTSQFNEQNGSRIRSAAFTANAGDTLSVSFNYVTTDGSEFSDYAWARIISASTPANQPGATVGWLVTVRSGNAATGTMIPGGVTDGYDPKDTVLNFKDFSFNQRTAANPPQFTGLGDATGQCFADVNACGFTGWLNTRHSFAAAGSYRLEVGVINAIDRQFDSAMVFDFAGLHGAPLASPVPEPGTPWMMLTGGLFGACLMLRQRRRLED